MVKIEERIKEITTLLARAETDGGTNHLWASIEPRRNQTISLQNRYLDTLARMLSSSKEICVAVCCCNGKILLASNQEEAKDAKDSLIDLQNFINKQSLENYGKLVKNAIRNIYLLLEKDSRKKQMERTISSQNLKFSISALDEFELLIGDYFKSLIKNREKFTLDKSEKLQTSAKKVFEEVKQVEESEISSMVWDCLLPLEDTNVIVNSIINNNLGEKVITAIKSREGILSIKGRKNIHAEMKLVSKLCETEFPSEPIYIGISKLTCAPCQIAIGVLNESRFKEVLSTCGTHGGTYERWLVPNNFSQEEKEEIFKRLERCRYRKPWESTSDEIASIQAITENYYLFSSSNNNDSGVSSAIQLPPKNY